MSKTSHRGWSAAAIALATLAMAAPAGAKCLDDVEAMAKSHDLSSKPPTAVPGHKQGPMVTPQELGRSNGVITPPPVDDRSVIKPQANTDPGMSTAPNVRPTPSAPSVGGEAGRRTGTNLGKPDGEAASKRTRLQAALTAARASAEGGDEQACQESLSEARQIAEAPPSGK